MKYMKNNMVINGNNGITWVQSKWDRNNGVGPMRATHNDVIMNIRRIYGPIWIKEDELKEESNQ